MELRALVAIKHEKLTYGTTTHTNCTELWHTINAAITNGDYHSPVAGSKSKASVILKPVVNKGEDDDINDLF